MGEAAERGWNFSFMRAVRFSTIQMWPSSSRAGEVAGTMAKVFTIPVMPEAHRRRSGKRESDPRYIEGQRLLVEAMKYLAHQDRDSNKDAILLLSEHFRTRFRMTDRPVDAARPEPV